MFSKERIGVLCDVVAQDGGGESQAIDRRRPQSHREPFLALLAPFGMRLVPQVLVYSQKIGM